MEDESPIKSDGRRSARYQTNIDKYELLDFVLQPLNDKRKRSV